MKQIIYRLLLIIFLSGLIVFSCQKEAEQLLKIENLTNIEQAKMWYKLKFDDELELKSGNSPTEKIKAKPVWEKSYVSNKKNYKIVQIPLSTLGIFGMVPAESYNIYTQTGDKLYVQSLTTLIIVIEKKTGITHGFLMTVAPDLSYRNTYKEKSFHSGYLNWPKDFSGHIMYHNLDGSFNNGWRIEDGNVTQKTSQTQGDNLGLQLKSNPCVDYFWVEYYIYCTDWWVMTETGTNYMGYTCDWNVIEEWTYLYTDCLDPYTHIDETDFGDESGGYTTDEDANPQVTQLVTGLDELFSNNTLNNDDTQRLNTAYELMRENCIFEYIDNNLLNSNVQLNTISIDPSMLGIASVTSSNNLKFGSSSDINAANLKHEWFHLFQRYNGNINVFDSNYSGMAEFENALLKDIMYFVEINGQHELVAYSWACVEQGDIYREEYMEWLGNITEDGASYPEDLNDSEFQYFSNIFGEVSTAYSAINRGYIYGVQNYGTEIISDILNYARYNCNN